MPKIVDKDEKRAIILKSALKIFSEKGAAATRITDIAAEAGIGKGTIYEYFSSKDDIFNATFFYFTDELNTIVAKKIYNVIDPLEKLKAFFNAWIEAVDSPALKSFRIMIEFWAEGVRRQPGNTDLNMAKMYSDYRLMIQNLLDDCITDNKFKSIDTHLAAAALIGAMDGVMIQWVLEPDIFDIQKALTTLRDIFLKGLSIR